MSSQRAAAIKLPLGSTTTVRHVHHQNDMKWQRPLAQMHSDQRLTDPNTSSDGTRTTANPVTVARSTPRTAPPSTLLPPLPLETSLLPAHATKPLCQSPRARAQVSTMSTRKPTGETPGGTSAGADVAHNASPFLLSVSRPESLGEDRRSEPKPHNQGIGELRRNVVPESHSCQSSPDAVPAPPPKSGLLKRLTTRLAGTRSSPSLRPTAVSSGVASKGFDALHTQREEDESLGTGLTSAPAPARSSAPTPNEKSQPQALVQQSLNSRLSFAGLAEKRADKREARAREEQRTTDARRAAALAERGLLPASRRYSVVHVVADEHGCGPTFDPFAKDGIQQARESSEGVEVEEVSGVAEGTEGELSAAEVVIREWRERNARAIGVMRSIAPNNLLPSQDSDIEKKHRQGDAQDVSSPVQEASISKPLLSSAKVDRGVSLLPRPAPGALGETETSTTAEPAVADEDAETIAPTPNRHLAPLPPPPPEKKRLVAGNATARKQDRKDTLTITVEKTVVSTKAGANEKTALGAWRFPAAVTPTVPDSSGSVTPRAGKMTESVQPSSPASPKSASSVSTTLAGQSKSVSSHLEDAPPPPPPKPKKDTVTDHKKEKTPTSQTRSAVRPARLTQPPPSPAQISLPASSDSPTAPSLGLRPRVRSSTAPSVSQTTTTPPVCAPTQPNIPSAPSQAFSLSLPALSPTTSTGTSISGGSALPRTPSTSSHGHSHICVLDTPLEDEEDALLSDEPTAMEGVTDTESRVNEAGMKEFGELANLAELDPESHEFGALPPLSLSASRDPALGTLATPVGEERSGDSDRRRRTTLFGRRRVAQNGPPMIAIPENVAGLSAAGRANRFGQDVVPAVKPRHASSLTNLRRTVTSVTAGLAGTGMRASSKTPSSTPPTLIESVSNVGKKASLPGRDRGTFRGATMPTPRPLASPRSNKSGAGSLPPIGGVFSSPSQCGGPGIGLRVQPLNPTMHSRGSILLEAHAIEDEESRRLSELAFLD